MSRKPPGEATSPGLEIPKHSRFSPLRHHQRTASAQRMIKETKIARSDHIDSEEDEGSVRRINQFVILQEIGRGSFGIVHLATDQYNHELAVKEFSKHRLRRRAKSNMLRQTRQQRQQTGLQGLTEHPGLQQDTKSIEESAFDLIKEEIAIMKKLHHVNLVSLYEVIDDPNEDSLYMVMEMCKKGPVMRMDVGEAVEPYNEDNCRYWFRDLMFGVEYRTFSMRYCVSMRCADLDTVHAQGIVHRK